MSERVVVAMSGGVDSSVAAAMMKKRGFEVIGLTMQLSSAGSRCCSDQDVLDARRVARALDIPHYVVSFREVFRKNVIDYFIDEYTIGRTPNPCAVCNPAIKFGVLLDRAVQLGARRLVTGHYARVSRDKSTGRWVLKRGRERRKDQSYFLARLSQEQLGRSMFPIGNHTKSGIREIALKMNLPIAQKAESQEVCFVPDSGVARFIENERKRPFPPGKLLKTDGSALGDHPGIIHYTVGQRKGLGIALGRPMYVTAIDGRNHTVTVGDDHELYHRSLIAAAPHWIGIPHLSGPLDIRSRIRYKHRPALSTVEPAGKNEVLVHFRSPQRAITPGQLVVFYQDDRVAGSAWIDRVAD
ncbi:tRNA 2-thiouridine(34) synthase MnmA [bacterium]|nr:tRNA 2-thiouridine(34) synthase MnmA [bacterium]